MFISFVNGKKQRVFFQVVGSIKKYNLNALQSFITHASSAALHHPGN